MPRKLVIHVGAQKCASTSLQASLRCLESESDGLLSFAFPKPSMLRHLQELIEEGSTSGFDVIDNVLSGLSADQAVISHEMLGNRPRLVCWIAERAILNHEFDQVVIAGYTRLQSNYYVSAFSQWHFRDQKRLQNDIKLFKDNGLDWQKFSAIERSLFAVALVGKDRSWNSDYKKLAAGVRYMGDKVCLVSNHIPTSSRPYSLLGNFCALTGIETEGVSRKIDVRKNSKFHPVVIYGLSSHLSGVGMRQTCFPGPHEGNLWLFRVCDRLAESVSLKDQIEDIYDPWFLKKLLGHLDRRTFKDNLSYCEFMSVNSEYFTPSDDAELISTREEIIDLAHSVTGLRNSNDVRRFERTVQNLFMEAARAEIISR